MTGFLRTLTLAAASAITAEFLLGDQYLAGMSSPGAQLAQLVLYLAFYGSAAVLIREIARRTSHGWPTILLLALAFGVLEEGIITQSLFNPDYVGQHLIAYGFVPGLGTSGPWLVFVLTLHVVWSIGSPIAVAETLVGSSRPWIGRVGLAVAAVLFVVGAAAIFLASAAGGFMAPWWRLGSCAVIAVLLIVVALLLPRRSDAGTAAVAATPAARRHLTPWSACVVGLLLTTGFHALRAVPQTLSPWVPTVIMLLVIAVGVVVALIWRPDAFGFAAGAILTYCWVGIRNAIESGSAAAVIEQCLIVTGAIVVLAVAGRRRVASLAGKTAGDRFARRPVDEAEV